MERLTKRITENQIELSAKANTPQHYSPIIHMKHPFWIAIDKLAEYEQAEEDGLLIRLPCKVGTTVYIVNRYWIDEGHICGIAESDDVDCFCYKVYCDPDCYDMVALVEFNKTWFLTKAEAEQALEKMKENKYG